MTQTSTTVTAASGNAGALEPSERMPVLFLGHGSPMNAIEDNEYRRSWQALGAQFGTELPRPRLILCISAHWLTEGWALTAMDRPRTIHDFGGFPQELFDQQYPAPGDSAAAREISRHLREPSVALDTGAWGLDHGCWSVLKPMFPAADIPVIQLSMDYSRPPAQHLALGRQLGQFRDQGVLIVGSGNFVHSLRSMRRGVPSDQAYDWGIEFDRTIAAQIEQGDFDAVARFQELGTVAQLSHPTHEHFLPLLYAAGAADPKERMRFFNANFQGASISMRSVIWG